MIQRLAEALEPVREAWVKPGGESRIIRAITYILLAFGLIAVFSASTVESLNMHGNAWYIFFKQFVFAVLGIGAMLLSDRFSIAGIRRLTRFGMIFALALLVTVLVVGNAVNGQKNWIPLGPFSLQPSEFAKLAVVLYTAQQVAVVMRRTDDSLELMKTIAIPFGAVMVLILAEKDMGNVLVLGGIMLAMMFAVGVPMRFIGTIGGVGLVGFVGYLFLGPRYRRDRILSWLDPYADPEGNGWQWIHGNYALALGGLFGQGPGASKEKWGALPEAHTDFILAVVGEEYGFAGTLITLLLLFGLIVLLFRVAMQTRDPFRRLTLVGVGAWVLMQAMFNVGAVVGALPIVGVTLPLVSYGGSSLLPMLVGLGIAAQCTKAGKS